MEKIALLSILLKGFYAPLMIAWFVGHSADMLFHFSYVYQYADLIFSDFRAIFQSHLYWLIFKIILFFDVLFFTIGYLVELSFLNNTIKSVETTVLGWALACYPPFNDVTLKLFAWHSTIFQILGCSIFSAFYFFFVWAFIRGLLGRWDLKQAISRIVASFQQGLMLLFVILLIFLKILRVGAIPAILAGFSRDFSDGFFIVFCLFVWLVGQRFIFCE